jgi:N-acetylmuramoyl-L-alanine amidase
MASVSAEQTYTVVLDPGHGGTQNGAMIAETREADIVLDIAKRVQRSIQRDDVEVLLTRSEDIEMSLSQRASFANERNANLFISIHANAAPSSDLFGIETYSVDIATDSFSNQVAIRENKGDEESLSDLTINPSTMLLSLELADLQQRKLVSTLEQAYPDLGLRDLGAKTALFSVLVRTEMPAILIEIGFLTNEDEFNQILTAHYREHIAMAIVECIDEWIERNKE